MKLAMITAGGAGMFCGSCMQDNTLVRSLRLCGVDALLIPTYTPIRVDEENASSQRVFMGGINVYLDSAIPGWSRLPGFLKHWLDRPSIIRLLSKFGSSTDASKLGPLTIDMLKGDHGPQQHEVQELVDFLSRDLKPDVIVLSNALISGILPLLARSCQSRILVMLQGDDIFLEGLPPRYRHEAIGMIAENCQSAHGFLTHSQYYATFMKSYLRLPHEKFGVIPLTLDDHELPDFRAAAEKDSHRFRVGYFARICPEKGVFNFLDMIPTCADAIPDSQFVIAGYLPGLHRSRFEKRLAEVQRIVGDTGVEWAGSPETRADKFKLLMTLDALCVPADYREPKGLYVLEAGLAGVPVVVPSHGAFPERLAALEAGRLAASTSAHDLVDCLKELRSQQQLSAQTRRSARLALRERVQNRFSMQASGRQILEAIQQLQ